MEPNSYYLPSKQFKLHLNIALQLIIETNAINNIFDNLTHK